MPEISDATIEKALIATLATIATIAVLTVGIVNARMGYEAVQRTECIKALAGSDLPVDACH